MLYITWPKANFDGGGFQETYNTPGACVQIADPQTYGVKGTSFEVSISQIKVSC